MEEGSDFGLRQRSGKVDVASIEGESQREADEDVAKEQSDGDEENEANESVITEEDRLGDLTKDLPQSSDKTMDAIDTALAGLSPRTRNYVVRTIFTVFMVTGFGLIIFAGPLALMLLVLAIQVKCFKEIIAIGYAIYRVHKLPWFRTLSWFFLCTSEYFFLGEGLIDYFRVVLRKTDFLHYLVKYHRFFSFSLYLIGIVWFVLSLKKNYYMRQFSLFAWTHCTLLIVVAQSYLIIQNIFQGTIWFLVPVSIIVCNDIMAYIFGYFFGKTPLIKLSPKKTWEGFIGGAVSTVIFGIGLSWWLLRYPRMVCPIEYYDENTSFMDCEIPSTFTLQEYNLPKFLTMICKIFRISPTVHLYPFLLHAFVLSLFASIVGPFGGFFASGFKRAFKIKDFGDVIPGHGGLMDRFDCQLLMGTFANVYISSFVRMPDPTKLLRQIFLLRADEQIAVFNALQEHLMSGGMLNQTQAAE